MVCRTTGKLLLLLHVLGATAQEPTVIAKAPKDYLVTGGPAPQGSDIVAESDGPNIKIYLGPDRASAFKSAVQADCANMDAKCIGSAQKALGVVPNEDGLEKRVVPLIAYAAGAAVVAMIAQWIYLMQHEKDYNGVAVSIPTPTAKEEQDVYATATAIVFKPSDAAQPTKVEVAGPTVTADVKFEPGADPGDTVVTFPPGEMGFWKKAADHALCPRAVHAARDDIPVCLRRQTESAILAAILNGGIGGMELLRLPGELQILGNQQLTDHITSLIAWAKTFKTVYSEADLRRLVQIIAVFIWQTFKSLDNAADILTIIEIELNRMTLKKGKVQVKTDEQDGGCSRKIDPAKDIPGYDAAYQAILAAIAADPNWATDPGDGSNGDTCPAPDGNLSDPSMPKADVDGYIKKFCGEVANTAVGKDPVARSYQGTLFTAWLSANKIEGDQCKDDPKLVEADCVKNMEDGLTKCAKDDKIYGIDVKEGCIEYKITTDGNQGDTIPPWDRPKARTCSKELSNVPYNFFNGVYPAFCKGAGKDKLDKTLTGADYQKPARKRSPPLDPKQFDHYNFHFTWTGGDNCKVDCNRAFQELTGVCGTQVMAQTGTIDVGCGKYDYAIEVDDKAHDKICFKEQKDVRGDKSKWKWGQRDQMVDAIQNKFCKLNFKDDKYKGGIVEETYDNDHDTFKLRLEVKGDSVPSPELCVEFLQELVDGCDAHPELNQHNLKWGGRTVHKSTGNIFEVVPTQERVATQSPNWECNTWANRQQKDFKGKDGKPLPEETDDQMMKLQCVHQYYNMGWITSSQDCGGHYNIIMTGSNGYRNSQDCWRYNFPCISDSIVNQGGVIMTATHWAGSAGHVKNWLGIRCWVGFDNY